MRRRYEEEDSSFDEGDVNRFVNTSLAVSALFDESHFFEQQPQRYLLVIAELLFMIHCRTLFLVKWGNPLSLPISIHSLSTTPQHPPPSHSSFAAPQRSLHAPPSFQVDMVFCESFNDLFWITKELAPQFMHRCVWEAITSPFCFDMILPNNEQGDGGMGSTSNSICYLLGQRHRT